ncbi:MAG: alpha/beta hydrolase-fold protein [Bryobacteraceae bacterium]
MKLLTATALCAASLLRGEDYVLGPDSQPKDGVPKGAVTKYVLRPGKFFPGTPHDYSIYVPAQYDAAKPAPVLIYLDGGGGLSNSTRVNVVLDNLIARGELPAMIGIFINPGVLPAVSEKAQSRFERVFEYDSLSDRFARFLSEEVLVEVGKKYNLSSDPNARAITGVSTGAVGAFMAAWNRPDQFRRVLSFIGTFVAMKGADGLPAIIRKSEPKPLRVFLQAGKNDHIVPAQPYGTFFAGSWPIASQVMYEALQSVGTESKLVIGTEGHNMKHGSAIMPEALRWLWSGYPEPIKVHEPAAVTQPGWDGRGKVLSTVWLDKGWQQIAESVGALTSPVAHRDGSVFFADGASDRIWRVDGDGKASVFREQTAGVRAIAIGPKGLYAWQPAMHRIVAWDWNNSMAVIANNVEAPHFTVSADGVVYFTDGAHGKAGWVDTGGRVHETGVEMAAPAGITLSPDQAMVVISDEVGRLAWSFQVAPDGSLRNGEPFYRLEMPESGWKSAAVGVAEDSIGQVYFATAIGIQVCEANGRLAMILHAPERGEVTSVAFGGPEMNWMFATVRGHLFRRPAKVKGVGGWAPAALPRPPL